VSFTTLLDDSNIIFDPVKDEAAVKQSTPLQPAKSKK
jgi:hypothetical protein